MTEGRLPILAVLLGVAGLVPFIVVGLMAIDSDPAHGQAAILALLTYSSVVLSFLGGVHWGFVLEGEREAGERQRLVLGTVPALVGWAGVVLGLLAHPIVGLGILIAGFFATAIVETRAGRLELMPRGYLLLRWALTVGATALLTVVLVLRLIHAHLMF
jgi:hypothetical protein